MSDLNPPLLVSPPLHPKGSAWSPCPSGRAHVVAPAIGLKTRHHRRFHEREGLRSDRVDLMPGHPMSIRHECTRNANPYRPTMAIWPVTARLMARPEPWLGPFSQSLYKQALSPLRQGKAVDQQLFHCMTNIAEPIDLTPNFGESMILYI